jgi:hypothetical protein
VVSKVVKVASRVVVARAVNRAAKAASKAVVVASKIAGHQAFS